MPLRPGRVGGVGVIGHPVTKTAVVADTVTPGPSPRGEDRGRCRSRHPGRGRRRYVVGNVIHPSPAQAEAVTRRGKRTASLQGVSVLSEARTEHRDAEAPYAVAEEQGVADFQAGFSFIRMTTEP